MVKKSKLVTFPFGLILISCMSGCISEVPTFEEVAESQLNSASFNPELPSTQSIILTNALEPDALTPTNLGLYPLALNAMSVTSATQLLAPNGTHLRRLLQYIVGCALPRDEHFDFEWTDFSGTPHREHFQGDAGLAPNWKNAAMTVPEQEWVSACLAARSNWYGQPIRISMRGSLSELDVNDGERNTYPHREGGFWGNIFSSTPYLNACFDANSALYSRTQRRECAAGHLESGIIYECGMISITGSCPQACSIVSPDGYYSNCSVNQNGSVVGTPTNRVITPFLR